MNVMESVMLYVGYVEGLFEIKFPLHLACLVKNFEQSRSRSGALNVSVLNAIYHHNSFPCFYFFQTSKRTKASCTAPSPT